MPLARHTLRPRRYWEAITTSENNTQHAPRSLPTVEMTISLIWRMQHNFGGSKTETLILVE